MSKPTPIPTTNGVSSQSSTMITDKSVDDPVDTNDVPQCGTNDEKDKENLSLSFENYVDLQTRLVLLPCNDDDGNGAVIHSYTPTKPIHELEGKGDEPCGNEKISTCDATSTTDCTNGMLNEIEHDEKKNDGGVTDDELTDNVKGGRSAEEGNSSSCLDTDGDQSISCKAIGAESDDKVGSDQNDKNHKCGPPSESMLPAENCVTEGEDQSQLPDACSDNGNTCKDEGEGDNIHKNDSPETGKKLTLRQENTSVGDGSRSADLDVVESDAAVGAIEEKIEQDQDNTEANVMLNTDPEGAVLINIIGIGWSDRELRFKDFSSILSTIREAPTPITLIFEKQSSVELKQQTEDEAKVETECRPEGTASRSDENGHQNGRKSLQGKGRWRRWGGEAASLARNAVIAGKELAEKQVTERQKAQQHSTTNTASTQETSDRDSKECPDFCGLFLQTSSGKCLSLNEDLYTSKKKINEGESSRPEERRRISLFTKSPPNITNTSVLVIRISSDRTCPTLGYRYQWYRSTSKKNPASINNWEKLEGATSVVFQPSATDVGYRVKCMVERTENEKIETARCELPFVIKSDQVLFDAARKTFHPLHDDGESRVSCFNNMLGREEFQGLRMPINLYTNMNDENRQSGFFITMGEADHLLQDEGERIENVLANIHNNKAKSFYLTYWSSQNEKKRILKLKAPSRLARETFLIALGIASYEGPVKYLNTETVLFPSHTDIEPDVNINHDHDISIRHLPNEDEKKEETEICVDIDQRPLTPEIRPSTSNQSSVTPAKTNTKMIAIECELEKDMSSICEKLESTNKVVKHLRGELERARGKTNDLEDELTGAVQANIKLKEDYTETTKSLRLSERRIESLESDLLRVKEDQVKFASDHKSEVKKYDDLVAGYEKTIKSLENEKAVLAAAVEARDNKLNRMTALKEVVTGLQQKVRESKELKGTVDTLSAKNSSLLKTIDDLNTADKRSIEQIAKLKEVNTKMAMTVKKEKKAFVTAKAELGKAASQLQKIRSERNRFKQKAESLSKEISKICRNGRGIDDVERIMHDNEKLNSEVTRLRSEKKQLADELEESRISYVTYVQAQERAGEKIEATRAVQKCTELERLISNMTEYLNAKETQLQSIQQANIALTEELHQIHQTRRTESDI